MKPVWESGLSRCAARNAGSHGWKSSLQQCFIGNFYNLFGGNKSNKQQLRLYFKEARDVFIIYLPKDTVKVRDNVSSICCKDIDLAIAHP